MSRRRLSINSYGDISVTKQPSGSWVARTRFRDRSGRISQPQETAGTKAAARDALRARLGKMIAAGTRPQGGGNQELGPFLDEWLEKKSPEISPNSRRVYGTVLRRYIKPALGGVTLQELDTPMVQGFLETLTPATAKSARAVLRPGLGFAVRMGYIPASPVAETVLPKKRKSEKTLVRALSDEEIVAYRGAVQGWVGGNRYGPPRGQLLLEIVDVCIGSGMRIGEVLGLRWEDVNLVTGAVTVCGTITEDDGTRQPWTKTAGGYRTIRVGEVAASALARAHFHRRQYGAEMVFPSAAGTYQTVKNVEDLLRAARKHGPPEIQDITPHSFRKTIGTRLTHAGQDRYTASRFLGHSSTAVTEAYYIARPALVDVESLGALPTIREPKP